MKKSLFSICAALLALTVTVYWGCAKKQEEAHQTSTNDVIASETMEKAQATKPAFKPFSIYTDKRSPDNHFIPSGYMGDFGDIKIDEAHMANPHSGTTCIRVEYTARASQGARWAGVYWQNPANNWGAVKSGFNLTGAAKLSFWARGEKGGERIEEFKIGGIIGEYSDSDTAGIGPVVLTLEWKKYLIDLEGKDLSYINGGFAWSTSADVNPEGCVFYLDNIKYE